jgi:hypothetical protein
MAVIAVGSRPETPDVTKFFELPAVDRRFKGRAHAEGEREREREREREGEGERERERERERESEGRRRRGGAPYIRNSYLRWGLRWPREVEVSHTQV